MCVQGKNNIHFHFYLCFLWLMFIFSTICYTTIHSTYLAPQPEPNYSLFTILKLLPYLFIFAFHHSNPLSNCLPPPSPHILTPGLIFHVVGAESVHTKTEVSYCDPKGLIYFRYAVGMNRCFRSWYGTSLVESTAFDFGGGDPIVFIILSLVSGHTMKKLLNFKILVPDYLRFCAPLTQLYQLQ
jgi:hypothetical protein